MDMKYNVIVKNTLSEMTAFYNRYSIYFPKDWVADIHEFLDKYHVNHHDRKDYNKLRFYFKSDKTELEWDKSINNNETSRPTTYFKNYIWI